MESGRIWLKQQSYKTLPPINTRPSISCPPSKVQDKPNVLESMRQTLELCSSITVDGSSRVMVKGQTRIYTNVGTTPSSAKTSQLKDNITAVAPRFVEFITPRPPPNYYFFGSTIQVSMGGEPKAPNSVCAAGEIKRVG